MTALLDDSVLTSIITAAAAISGWAAFVYKYFSERPKIKGKLLQVMRGRMRNPENPSEELTIFTLFLYLTNQRKNAIHLRDYSLEVDEGCGFEKTKILRGDLSKLKFSSKGGEIQFPNFEQSIIHKQSKPIQFGVPFYGYLIFGAHSKYYNAEIKRYRITCVDVFDHKHKITTKPDKFVDMLYLQEMFKIKTSIPTTPNQGVTEYNQSTSNLISDNEVASNNQQ